MPVGRFGNAAPAVPDRDGLVNDAFTIRNIAR
jgi:hypothetical protein